MAESVTLKMGTITCMHCVTRIADAATKAGAQKVSGNVTQRTVKVVYEPTHVDLTVIVQAIEAAGHRVEAGL